MWGREGNIAGAAQDGRNVTPHGVNAADGYCLLMKVSQEMPSKLVAMRKIGKVWGSGCCYLGVRAVSVMQGELHKPLVRSTGPHRGLSDLLCV
jgi:hypothetical protein